MVLSLLTHPPRQRDLPPVTEEDLEAFISTRTLEYSARLEESFVTRALGLGVESGVILDVGTRVGLISLKLLWHNENFFAIGVDESKDMIERARETAASWGLSERAFFQVGDARKLRLKSRYFDLVVSDGVFHRFDSPTAVLAEIGRVIKPRGALLIRDFRRPNRLRMSRLINQQTQAYGKLMRPQIEAALRGAYTARELKPMLQRSGIEGASIVELDVHHIAIERRGMTDPGSWVSAREQYR